MKHLSPLAAAALLLAVHAGRAQSAITLSQATFPAAAGTAERYQDASLPTSTLPTPTGANQTWDYRTLAATGTPYILAYLPVPAGSPFAAAQWTRARTAYLGNFAYNFTSYYALGSAGRLGLGRTIVRQPTSLAALTGGANDSAVVNRQTITFTTAGGMPYRDIPLPLTTGSRVEGALRFGTTGTITVAAYGLNQAPFRIVQRIAQVDSVAGWGTARVPVAGSSGGSAALPVLQVRERIVQQDSLYLNGSPAPPALLAVLGLTQGQVRTYFTDLFFRNNSAQPVLDLYYATRQFGTPYAADYSTEATLLATREVTQASAGFEVWPNPARTGQPVQFTLPAAPASTTQRLTVRDALGRVVAQGSALAGQPTSLLGTLPAGLYLLEADTPAGRAVTRVTVE